MAYEKESHDVFPSLPILFKSPGPYMHMSFACNPSVIGESKKLACLPSLTNASENLVVSVDNFLSSILGTIL